MTDADRSYMAELANHLGELFSDLSSIGLMAEEVGLDQEKIPYQPIPVDYWRRVLQEAIKSNKGITPVIQVALSRYPNNKKLVELFTKMPRQPDPWAVSTGIERISQQMTEMQTEQKSQNRKLTALAQQVNALRQDVAGLSQQMITTGAQ